MRLCINCDDFGYSPEINKAALEAIDLGFITSCSVMAHQVTAGELNRLADSAVSIGLHVTLTGRGKGCLAPSPFALARKLLGGKIDAEQIRREINRQLSRFLELSPTPISHLDSHQHIHLIPMIHRILIDIAANNNIGYLRIPWETSKSWSIKKIILNSCFERQTEPCFWGTGFMGDNFTAEKILNQLDYLERLKIDEAVWMVHPGYETTSIPIDRYNTQRRREFDVLKQLSRELSLRCTLVPMTGLRYRHQHPQTTTGKE